MRDFLILFKREVKMQFPRPQKGRTDWFGSLVTLLITLAIAVVFIILVRFKDEFVAFFKV